MRTSQLGNPPQSKTSALRAKILDLVKDFYKEEWPDVAFQAGETAIPYSGRTFDADDLINLVDSSLDFWLTAGRYAKSFERALAEFLGLPYAILCNSGSSANLLAMSALTSPKLGERRLLPGDEVITAAVGFPTTVNPIIQNRLIPVFVDVDVATYNVNIEQLEAAIGPKTRAIFLAHTLGNPFNVAAVRKLADTHGLWLIEDNCDAFGSTYQGQLTGTFGDLSTLSFYPAHHITTGEGGCVLTKNPTLKVLTESFRDWGRDCFCDPGRDNSCGRRFDWKLGNLPAGYDHKFIYSHLGYNLKMTDMQASVGLAQLKKLPDFVERRKQNWQKLLEGLKRFEDQLILPRSTEDSDPAWFGFPITIRSESGIKRTEFARFLDDHQIGTRPLMSGNLVRQPAYQNVELRVASALTNADLITTNSLVLGVYPGITDDRLQYIVETSTRFLTARKSHSIHSVAPKRSTANADCGPCIGC